MLRMLSKNGNCKRINEIVINHDSVIKSESPITHYLTDAKIILESLPEKIKAALIARAAEIDYPVEAIIKMAFT